MTRIATATVALIAASAASAAVPTWDQIQAASWSDYATKSHESAGKVQVLSSTIQGMECFKGMADTLVPAEVLYQVAADITGTMKWSTAGVTEAELLSTSGADIYYYQYLDVPGWTMSADRFWFLHGHTARADGKITFTWDKPSEGGPHADRYKEVRAAHPDAVEPPVNVGGWVFTPVGGSTHIDYYICTDTGGYVPRTVQSAATTRTLPDTLGDLVREGRKRQ
ncbi:MAG: hypothetical protein JXX28_15775 [Deltaproteobacteria bacterium]|nr:hypothetical protein [Deltaproteobacteria bacterium]